MLSLIANWKTTLAGVGAILASGGHLLIALSHGDTSTVAIDIPSIIAGFGLMVAKDGVAK